MIQHLHDFTTLTAKISSFKAAISAEHSCNNSVIMLTGGSWVPEPPLLLKNPRAVQ